MKRIFYLGVLALFLVLPKDLAAGWEIVIEIDGRERYRAPWPENSDIEIDLDFSQVQAKEGADIYAYVPSSHSGIKPSTGPHSGIPGGRFASLIKGAGQRHGLDPKLIAAVIDVESGGDPSAVSPKGARGLMQIMPQTWRALSGGDPHDPAENIDAGTRYLAEQLDRFGRLDHALAAYNAGPSAVSSHGGIPPFPETRAYVKEVLRRYSP